jgi:hypothetical protein
MERAGCSPPSIRLHPFLAPKGTDLTEAVAHQTYLSLLPHSKPCVCHHLHFIAFTSLYNGQCFVTRWYTISLLSYLLTYLLTYSLTPSMEQSHTWEANRLSTGQEISRFYKNQRFITALTGIFLYRGSSIKSMTPSQFIRTHFNIILLPRPRSCKWYLSLRFPYQKSVCTSPRPHTSYIPRLSHSSPFDHPNNIWWSVRWLSSLLCSFLHTPLISSLLVLSSKTLSLRSSLSVSDKVTYPHKKQATL